MSDPYATATPAPDSQGAAPGGAASPCSRRREMIRVLAGIAIYLLVVAVWLSLPLGRGIVSAQITVPTTPRPRSETRQFSFEFKHFVPLLTVTTELDSRSGTVEMALLDSSGNPLVSHWRLTKGRNHSSFSVGKGFPAGKYTLQFRETGFPGAYTVRIFGDQQPLSAAGRLCLLAALALVVTAPLHGYARISARRARARGAGAPDAWREPRWARMVLLGACLLIVGLPLATLAHEGGHALAQAAFGGWDPSHSNLLGLVGEASSQGRAYLTGWKRAVVSIAGPALPNILAYLSFALWVSPPGRRIRSRRRTLDALWSTQTLILLFGQLGMLLALAGLMTDSDYSNFVQPLGSWEPVADVSLIAVALINATLIWVIGRRLLRLWRGAAATT